MIAKNYFHTTVTTSQIALWFEPMANPVKLLLVSFLLGIIHLFVGVAVNCWQLLRQHKVFDAVFDTLPVYFMILGIMPFGAGIFVPVNSRLSTYGLYLAAAGAVIFVLTSARASRNPLKRLLGGLYGMYNFASGWLGDILSYSRLLALGLATGSIAGVINMMATMPENMVLKTVLLLIVFPLGHGLNIAVNLLGAYVHAARLQFVELYKALGSLNDVPALFKVIDIFETNKTAYAITEYVPGISLKEFLLRNGGLLSWEQARPLFMPLIAALRTLHDNGVIHGAISPETLMVGRDGRMRISAFCINSVRISGNEMVPELFGGYAAVEQYDGTALTAATDIYAFAATIFRTITGNPLSESVQRRGHDNLNFPRAIAEKTPRGVLVAMANALQVEPEDRTRHMQQFKEDLEQSDPAEPAAKEQQKAEKKAGKAATRKYTLIAALATALVLCLVFGIAAIVQNGRSKKAESSSSSDLVTSTVSVGDIGNSSTESKYSVPDFTGKTVASLLSNEEYQKWFKFSVVKKEYNNKVPKGKICGQSVSVGTAASKATPVELTVSLGSSKVTLPKKLKGKTRSEAYITLLEMGFDPDSIQFIEKKGEPTKEEVVLSTSPDLGESVSVDSSIIVYYNTNIVVDEPQQSSNEDTGYDFN